MEVDMYVPRFEQQSVETGLEGKKTLRFERCIAITRTSGPGFGCKAHEVATGK
jgi:hypothetical protein